MVEVLFEYEDGDGDILQLESADGATPGRTLVRTGSGAVYLDTKALGLFLEALRHREVEALQAREKAIEEMTLTLPPRANHDEVRVRPSQTTPDTVWISFGIQGRGPVTLVRSTIDPSSEIALALVSEDTALLDAGPCGGYFSAEDLRHLGEECLRTASQLEEEWERKEQEKWEASCLELVGMGDSEDTVVVEPHVAPFKEEGGVFLNVHSEYDDGAWLSRDDTRKLIAHLQKIVDGEFE